jgi:hypothetical protein
MNEQAPNPSECPINISPTSPLKRKRPPDVRDDVQRLMRWLYTNNPFYAISAALVFVGLWRSFEVGGSAPRSGSLALGLASYTLLLAATAWFLIRFGDLWQDVRTLLVLVVLMLLGLSVSLDRALVENPEWGIPASVVALVFALGLSESLLRGIRLRLPLGFRLPYYAILALFFLYPVAISHWADEPNCSIVKWGMFGFSPLAGVVFLTLWPATRRGAEYVSDNGSPWQWPWYPWVLFGTLAMGICLRSYYLCISFHAVEGSRTIFGLYFLVPFLWSIAYLLLEIGITSRRVETQVAALLLCLGLIPMALTASPHQADDLGFLTLFHDTLHASPFFLTLLAVTAFHLIAILRRVSEASLGLAAAVVAYSLCGPDTFNSSTTWGPYGLPILLLGLLFFIAAIRKRSAGDCLAGAWCVVFMLWIDYRESSFAAHRGAIPLHLLLVCVLGVGAVFRDAIGKMIQKLGAVGILLFALVAALCPPQLLGDPPQWLQTTYPLSVAALAIAYGFANKSPWYYATAVGSAGAWLAVPGWNLFLSARRSLAGMDYIIWGTVSFLVALLVSLAKMRFFHRICERWRDKN